eukprot:XP_011243114.1 PREDICTED: uncharacterized protein Gm10410 isoform X4 [Mus musculus]
MSPFPSGAFSSLLLPRTRGGESPLPDLLLHAPPYLYSPFPLSPPDPRRSKREVLRGLSRFPSSHSGAGHILGIRADAWTRSQHHPQGFTGGAVTGASAVSPTATGPGEDSSNSESEQEGPQKLVHKVSTSGQMGTK